MRVVRIENFSTRSLNRVIFSPTTARPERCRSDDFDNEVVSYMKEAESSSGTYQRTLEYGTSCYSQQAIL